MTTTAEATAAGRAARELGHPSTTCPYGDDEADLRRAWVTGWVDQRHAELFGDLEA